MTTPEASEHTYRPRDLDWHPAPFTPAYKSSIHRSPKQRRIALANTPAEICGPVFGHDLLGPDDHDLLVNYAQPGQSAIGERIMVHGKVFDEGGRGVAGALLEFWQANAGGRYRHVGDQYTAPLDPNFGGCGRTITGEDGSYMLRTVKPGPYPWMNGPNDWRPAHIHFSIFGLGFAQRLITQMYFEGDPMIPLCPIVGTIPDPMGVKLLTAQYDHHNTLPMDLRAYRFNITLRGRHSTPF